MIKKDTVVSLNYNLTNDSGEQLDSTQGKAPFKYLHGVGQIVPGLEKALEGALVGDKKQVTVSPEEGYGQINDQLRMEVNRSNFPGDADLKPGLQFMADVGEGRQHMFTITKVDNDAVHVDGNHPLAGQTLNFSVEVMEVREATAEELQHGHVHGEGGHHH